MAYTEVEFETFIILWRLSRDSRIIYRERFRVKIKLELWPCYKYVLYICIYHIYVCVCVCIKMAFISCVVRVEIKVFPFIVLISVYKRGRKWEFSSLWGSQHSVKNEKGRILLFWVMVCILDFIAVPLNFHLCWHLGILSLLFLKCSGKA